MRAVNVEVVVHVTEMVISDPSVDDGTVFSLSLLPLTVMPRDILQCDPIGTQGESLIESRVACVEGGNGQSHLMRQGLTLHLYGTEDTVDVQLSRDTSREVIHDATHIPLHEGCIGPGKLDIEVHVLQGVLEQV